MVAFSQLVALLLLFEAQGFAPIVVKPRQVTTELGLVPSQGCQLAAAWNAAHPKESDDSSKATSGPSVKAKQKQQQSPRDFVAHVFSLPSTLLHPLSHAEDVQDVVMFPIVGFKILPEFSRALPTSPSASCRIPPGNEEVYGWYSEACILQPFDADEYCLDPTPQTTES